MNCLRCFFLTRSKLSASRPLATSSAFSLTSWTTIELNLPDMAEHWATPEPIKPDPMIRTFSTLSCRSGLPVDSSRFDIWLAIKVEVANLVNRDMDMIGECGSSLKRIQF